MEEENKTHLSRISQTDLKYDIQNKLIVIVWNYSTTERR